MSLQDEADLAAAPFLTVTLYSPAYRDRAERLAASCRTFGLPAAFVEAPSVHRSISRLGGDDLELTKPAIIAAALATWGKPVLYLDADMVIRERLDHLSSLTGCCDLAIYNWLADTCTDAWKPVEGGGKRYWEHRHAIDYFDPTQLFCSGGTQLWSPSPAALVLLADWQAVIAANPGVADDECLDFAFNNRDNSDLRPQWLGKEFVRVPWWPHVKPVIDHPDAPGDHEPAHIAESGGRKRFYPERAQVVLPPPGSIPRAAIIDVEEGWLLRRTNDGLVKVEPAKTAFWL